MRQLEMTAKEKLGIKTANNNTEFSVEHLRITNVRDAFVCLPSGGDGFMTSEIHIYIHTASSETHGIKNDTPAGKSEFFNMHNYNAINFTGYNSIRNKNNSLYGELTIGGITRRIKLNVEPGEIVKDASGRRNPVFLINGMICRNDWGVNWDCVLEANGYLIDNELKISCNVRLTNQERLAYYYSFFYSIYSSQSNYLIQRKSYFMGG